MKVRTLRKLILRVTLLPIVLTVYSVAFAQHPGWTIYTKSNSGLPDSNVNCINIDVKGNKWIGTNEHGIVKFDGSKWTVYDTSNSGLPYNTVNCIAEDKIGNEWFGTEGGLAKFDGTEWTVYYEAEGGLPGLPDNYILSIAIDNNETKWIGTYYGGLAEFNGTTWKVHNEKISGLDNTITSIAIDTGGNKWIGTMTSSLAEIGSNGLRYYYSTYSNPILPSNHVTCITIDKNGNKWIGTDWGLTKYDGITWTTYDISNGLPGGATSIAIDSNGNKWVGTNNGLAKYNDSSWISYDTINSGLPNDQITSIAIDIVGNKWIGTYAGGLAVFSGGNSVIKLNQRPTLKPLTTFCSNYPNPFKQKTLISYNVIENGLVFLRVYSLNGQLIQTLIKAKQTIGHYSVLWDGKNDAGKLMPHEIYLYRLTSYSGIISGKMNFIE
jgi:Predicted periplasmic ligand-binding sensor domain